MGKSRRSSTTEKAATPLPTFISPIAKPLANEKQTKKFLRLAKKASGSKKLRRGVKEVVKAIRKNEKGLCIIAGDISPVDVITHLPVLCEEAKIPYIYVPAKQALGAASSTKRPTSCVLITPDKSYADKYEKLFETAKSAQLPVHD